MSDTYTIQSVQRAINILNCFSEQDYYLTLNEISERLGLNINTTRGLVQTLLNNDLLSYNKDRKVYSLGFFLLSKANIVNSDISSIIDVCAPSMRAITNQYHVSCGLQIVQGKSIRTIYSCEPTNNTYHIIGTEYLPLPLHASASGKLLLAYSLYLSDPSILDSIPYDIYTENTCSSSHLLLEDIKNIQRNGYSEENEEFESSIGSIAVPIFKSNRELYGTISITEISKKLNSQKQDLIKGLKEAIAEIENNLKFF